PSFLVNQPKVGCQHLLGDPRAVRVDHVMHLRRPSDPDPDAIAHGKPGLLSHTLYPTDDLACPSLEPQFRRNRLVQRYEETALLLNSETSRRSANDGQV